MKITVVSHGGWSAGLRLPPLEVDTNALSVEVASKAQALVTAANDVSANPPGVGTSAESIADGMSYRVTISDGGKDAVLKSADSQPSPAVDALVDFVRQHCPRA